AGLLLQCAVPVEPLFHEDTFGNGIKEKVRYIVSQRTTDEEFHRKVVNTFGILALVCFLGFDPSLRKDIAHRVGKCFEALAIADLSRLQDVIKYEVALVERIVPPSKLHWAAAVSFYELI